jgi:hypothetical protein
MGWRPFRRVGRRVGALWHRVAKAVSWTPPTSTELGTVAKSGVAAGLAWAISNKVTGVPDPVLAALTALVVVQVSVRASIVTALQRSGAVVLGVFLALVIGDALALNGFTVALFVAVCLGLAQLVLRLPRASAQQLPISGLVVLSAVAATSTSSGWRRSLDTLIGAAVGVIISLSLPASRLVDSRQTLDRLAASLGDLLDSMGGGLQQPWSTAETEGWRSRARAVRERMVAQADEAVGQGRDVARWNVRDRGHREELGRFEEVMPRLERTAIGVSVISRGLDDHARLTGTEHPAMRSMGILLVALADAVRALVRHVVHDAPEAEVVTALNVVRAQRNRCVQGAARRARMALEHDHEADAEQLEGEWLGYAAILVQVERIVGDLSAPLPAVTDPRDGPPVTDPP